MRNLVVVGCSATKVQASSPVPALTLYDGPSFRVIRTFLRDFRWPDRLSIAVLSAKYGLIGALNHIPNYNKRMTPNRAATLQEPVTSALQKLSTDHRHMSLVMGQDYLQSIDLEAVSRSGAQWQFASGAIGQKLNYLHDILRSFHSPARTDPEMPEHTKRPLYFLPDWDDFVDAGFDFASDKFSCQKRNGRKEQHTVGLMRPERVCDGVLVSLAQHLGSKGLLRRVGHAESDSLAPKSVREHFNLHRDQWAFGDCGAFSYVNEDRPTISVRQAVSLYDLYDFDLGASVDHIPIPKIVRDGEKVELSERDRKIRVKLTRDNADSFLQMHKAMHARFIPIGVIQGLTAADYSSQVGEYADMGYEHLALGGLVPRDDEDASAVVEGVARELTRMRHRPWLHLLGIFRPRLQEKFRQFGVNSFDSATYFRKAWLRSDQNYLGADGQWYAAIRVPPTSDGRTMTRLKESGISEKRIRNLERKALAALAAFDKGKMCVADCLDALKDYDTLLIRAEPDNHDVYEAYRITLEAKPWRKCGCNVCSTIGIHALIFRGLNRNKRRGAHNTLQLYKKLLKN